MNEMPHTLLKPQQGHQAGKHRRIKVLLLVAGLELVVIAALLVWVIAGKPATAPTITKTQTPSTPTELQPPQLALDKYATGLTEPVGIMAMPTAADKRLFVVQQNGQVRIVNTDKTVDTTPFLDISGKVTDDGEMGLLGLAFHPKVASNNYFYVNYVDKQKNTVIARYNILKDTGRADPASEKVLLKLKQPYPNHNGGALAFGPDGYLYVALGDGGSAGDPENRAQDTGVLFGKILRLDVDNGDPYAFPTTNPIGKGDGRQEIWAYGLRNPWRISFDRKTGDLYIADVGQGNYEEIDFQPASSKGGQNYGWRCYEGANAYNTAGCQPASAYVAPVLQYDHGDGRCSVTGGYVYRGKKYPAFVGKYFYADYCSGQIFYTSRGGATWKPTLALKASVATSTFGEDSSGELYLADRAAGTIYHLQDIAN